MEGTLQPVLGMDVGTTLRIARERRGQSIPQLAATTKIPSSVLKAIEDNAFEKVPGGIFTRGFIRAYAREVGLDAEEMIQEFLSETASTLSPAPGTQTPSQGAVEEIDQLQIDPDGPGSRPDWGYALIVAALVVGFVSFNRSDASEDVRTAAAEVAEAATSVVPAKTIPDAVATSGGALRVEMHARDECWVKAVVDGRTVVARLLQPGERVTTDAQHDVVLRVGDPAAFSYSINGQPGRPLGEAGTPVTVRFTSDGRQDASAS
jgi:cytoskeletal protein RodZ